MNQATLKLAAAVIAGAAIGYYIAKKRGGVVSTGAAAKNDVNGQADWWTYAGSWTV